MVIFVAPYCIPLLVTSFTSLLSESRTYTLLVDTGHLPTVGPFPVHSENDGVPSGTLSPYLPRITGTEPNIAALYNMLGTTHCLTGVSLLRLSAYSAT